MTQSSSQISRWIITLLVLFALVASALPIPAARATGIRHIQPAATSTASIIRVSPTGSTTWPCGTSWGATCTLQTALTNAASGDEIWVATGVYTPGLAITATFQITSGVGVYGGFAMTETLRDQRNIAAHLTILSGDLDNNDTNLDGNFIAETWADIQGSNAYHVLTLDGVSGLPITSTTVVDGFTLTAGSAASDSAPDERGGGLYCQGSGAGHACSPTLANLIFSGNQAYANNSSAYGGGMYADGSNGGVSSPALTNVKFTGNLADSNNGSAYGGGMYNDGSSGGNSNPTLSNVRFISNQAKNDGGGMYNIGSFGNSSPTLTNCLFQGNQASGGGGMFNEGGYGNSNPTLTNVLFSGNLGSSGGGLFNRGLMGNSHPLLTNVTFSGNAANFGGGIYNLGTSGVCALTLVNSILWGNTANNLGPQIFNSDATVALSYTTLEGSCPSGATCGTGMVYTNPLFVAPVAASLAPTALGDYHLQPGSPAIDAGNTPSVTALTDLDGNSRVVHGTVDLGAYEFGYLLYVDRDATGTNTGLSWTNAYPSLSTALISATSGVEIWVAEGVYKPTNVAGPNATFVISSGVQLYGGFAATETVRTERNPAAHLTILSGDLDNNDTNLDGNFIAETWANLQGTNAYHVLTLNGVSGLPITGTTVVDGFTITAGNANSNSAPNERGGGLYCKGSGAGHACSPTLTNLTFSGNQAYASGSAATYGGGVFADGSSGGVSSPALTNVTFASNRAYSTEADTFGGALYSQGAGGTSSPILNTVIFTGNQAYGADNFSNPYGGAMYNNGNAGVSSPVLTNVTFINNQAASGMGEFTYGGGMSNNGNNGGVSSPRLTQVSFIGNQALYGGALYNEGLGGTNTPLLVNVTFRGNRAPVGMGGGMYNEASSPTLINVLFSGNRADVSGGGMVNSNATLPTQPRLFNVTFSGNTASFGGAIYNGGGSGTCVVTLVNSILWGNTASNAGPQIFNESGNSTANLAYTTLEGSCPSGATCGTGMVYTNPLFIAPVAASAAPTTLGDYHLQFGSPAIDAGNTLSVTAVTDLDGKARIVNSVVDLGAYESDYLLLTVERTGTGDGNVTSLPTGINCGLSCTYGFQPNSVVTLTATPFLSSTFAGWSGAALATTNPVTVLMATAKNVTATFTLNTYTLTVATAGNGTGVVTPTVGLHPYLYGDVVTLQATANTGSTFTGWSGDSDCLDGAVTINGDLACTATFTLNPYTLTVATASNGSGVVTPTVGLHPYLYGDAVTLQATANTGSTFMGWSGDSDCTDGAVTINGNLACTATFNLITYTLNTNTIGNGRGSIGLTPPGGIYDYGTVVTMTASANVGSFFDGWNGAVNGGANPVTMTIDSNQAITATFNLITYTLNTNTIGNGNGSIGLTPPGGIYDYGTVVTATGIANVGSFFDSWQGATSGNSNPVTVTMDSDQSITATFNLITYTLNTNTIGNGHGSIILTPPGGVYDYGTVVTVTATPITGSLFAGWGGACTGIGACVVTMTQPQIVTATFNLITYPLSTNMIGTGSGTIDLTPPGGMYDYGTVVTVTATPLTGSLFAGWSGACTGTGACVVTMTQPQAVTATFNLITYTLSTHTIGAGSGTIDLNPPGGVYDYGTVVTITAVPDAGSSFGGWGGAIVTVTNPLVLTMEAAKDVTATFDLIPTCVSVSGASFIFAPLVPRAGEKVAFIGNVITGTTPITYTWGWGDNTAADSGANMAHTFPATNTTQIYTVTLSVSNACSGPISVVQPVTVQPWRNYLPLIQK